MSNLNDPRVLFAAERTLLAWTRTSLSLMGFGFVIERFGIFFATTAAVLPASDRLLTLLLGEAFVLAGTYLAFHSVFQHRRVLADLEQSEIPPGYRLSTGMLTNLLLAFLGIGLAHYLLHAFLAGTAVPAR